jgi:uncharacterized protein YbjT (DUF2867 family)
MRVLLTGATGLIGGAIARALLAQGHELVCAVRDPARLALAGPQCRALRADLAAVPDAAWWRAQLQGIDAVVNAVGILREQGAQTFEALHHRGPAALFAACAQAGVRCVVQVSALGADGGTTGYHRSKHAADQALRALPRRGAMPVQPVHLDDLVDGVLALLRDPPPVMETIAFAGPEPLPLAGYLASLRAQLQLGRGPWVLPLPQALFRAGAAVAGRIPSSALDADTATMLLQGNAAPSARFERLLGHAPRAAGSFVPPAQAALLRPRAVLGWALPLLRLALAALWIWTATVSLGLYPVQDSLALLARVGLHGAMAWAALYAAAGLDLLLGLLTLWSPPRWRPWVWVAQLALVAGYTVLITVFLPEHWLHPYGPISKNLPIMAAIALLWALEPRRR